MRELPQFNYKHTFTKKNYKHTQII